MLRFLVALAFGLFVLFGLGAFLISLALSPLSAGGNEPDGCRRPVGVVSVTLSAERYPHVAALVHDAVAGGYPSTLTLWRRGAPARRVDLLGDYPPRQGMTVVEYPPSFGRVSARAARARFVPAREGYAADRDVGRQLDRWCDRDVAGGRTRFRLEFG